MFSPGILDLLSMLSTQIATSLENGLLFEGLQREIEQRKQVAESLRQSEGRFRSMFETAAVGKAQCDCVNGRFLMVNKKFCEITGYSESELLNMTFADLTHLMIVVRAPICSFNKLPTDHFMNSRFKNVISERIKE